MNKYLAVALAVIVGVGFFASPLSASCTIQEVHDLVADWSQIPVNNITAETQLDGLGGKVWPDDAPDLIEDVEQLSGVTIPQADYELFAQVGDIDDFVDATEYLKDED